MPASASRHDHFPRHDAARRDAIRAAVVSLDAAWAAADSAPAGLLTAIDVQADAAPAAAIAALRPWLTDRRWLAARIDSALALLRADPFARPPLRGFGGGEGGGGDPAPGGLVLAERGHVRLTLRLWPFASAAPPEAPAIFVPGRAAIHVLASGGAQLCRHRVAVSAAEEAGIFTARAAAPCQSDPPRPLSTGETLDLDTTCESFTLVPGARDVLLLELTVQPPSPLPIRSYDPATGRLLHVSAARRDSSFRAMALTLLRHMQRPDAAPLFAAETESEDFAARWHAMRELIALAPAAARAPLTRMAATDPHPEVRAAAQATLALLSPLPLAGGGGGGAVASDAAQHAPPKPSPKGEGLKEPPMPRAVTPPHGPPLTLADVTTDLDHHGVDLTDEVSIHRCAALLAGLQRNRSFLADHLIAALASDTADPQPASRYSAQVILLHRSPRGWYLRANIWPAATDAAYAASGAAAFSYGVAHDHNFNFLTIGYFGPGYVSDYYEVDPEAVDGRLGEPLALKFVERSCLSEGQILLYRAHRDIHCQRPPASLSVSLNIMDEGDHVPWRDQFIVDRETRTIDRRPTTTSTELLLRCAVHLSDEAKDIADHVAQTHPVPRVRANAVAALAAVAEGKGRAAVLERGMRDRDARVRNDCRRWLAG